MNEVAPVSVYAKVVVFEAAALLGFVFGIVLVVLAEFAKSVSELAPLFVGTVPIFHVLFAELGLEFIVLGIDRVFFAILGGVGVALLVGPFFPALVGLGRLQLSSQHCGDIYLVQVK